MTGATLESIVRNLKAVRARMAAAAVQAGRDPAAIRLLAVSKTWPATAIEAACKTGHTDYGENYLQEALPKLEALRDRRELVWHFIGALQANKTRPVAEHFAWVHTVDRQRIAQRLDAQRPVTLPPLNVCIEVCLDHEPGKSGVEPAQVPALADYIASLPHLRLRGLMSIPPPSDDPATQRIAFRRLRELFDTLNNKLGHDFDTLSMGMSGDFEAAILEGATLIRIGTAIFGARPTKHS
ncbi:MAG: YggS family pyridoxal phosphate-dependent enzyme [Gammaproteobacteria bacterium]